MSAAQHLKDALEHLHKEKNVVLDEIRNHEISKSKCQKLLFELMAKEQDFIEAIRVLDNAKTESA